jgi:cation-transporting ATPase E
LLPPPPPPGGLTTAQAKALAAQGLANVDTSRQRTDGDVVRDNTLTFFNVVLGSLIIALLALGEVRDGLFVGIVVAANVAISTLQELKATRTLRELKALTAPQATVVRDGLEHMLPAEDVVQGDLVHLKPGDQVVADGTVVARAAELDESLLTGESDSVRKEPGSELKSGSFCTAGELYYTAEHVGKNAYIVRLTADARELVRRSTPLQMRFNRLLRVLLTVTALLGGLLFIQYTNQDRGLTDSVRDVTALVTTVVPVGLLLGMTVAFAVGAVRVSRSGAIVQEISAVEALNYTDVICLDKTGTLTANRLTVNDVTWAEGMEGYRGWLGAFARESEMESKTGAALAGGLGRDSNGGEATGRVPFSSARRWSAIRLKAGAEERVFVLGAPETVLPLCDGGRDLLQAYEEAAERGLRGVVFAEAPALPEVDRPATGLRALALITLGDVLRGEVRGAFEMMERLGIEPKIISGDNPRTVASLLAQLGIETKGGTIAGNELETMSDDELAKAVEAYSVFGRVSPALKARLVEALREQGHYVAMVGDGANDVRALRAADVAVAMASGTSTARAVSGIVLLDDSFEALIRGAKEATAVLGNAARLSKLFIAKSIYAFLLIVATNMLGLNFPFLPRQGSITALLTLGIPAIFISISIPPPDAGRDFTRNVLRFALPASGALAAAAISVHLLTEGVLGRSVEEARTLTSLTIGITALFFMVEVVGFEGASWRSVTRPILTTVLGILLVSGFLVTVYTPSLREFFDFTEVSIGDWIIIGIAVAAALAGQFGLSRYWQQLLDIVTARPKANEELRGRAV